MVYTKLSYKIVNINEKVNIKMEITLLFLDYLPNFIV